MTGLIQNIIKPVSIYAILQDKCFDDYFFREERVRFNLLILLNSQS